MEIQITAIKFETVDGKKTGRSFSFMADPKKLAVYKTEETIKKKIKEYVANSGIFIKLKKYVNMCIRSGNLEHYTE